MPRFTRRSTLQLLGATTSLVALSECAPLPEMLRLPAPVPLVAMWSNGAVSSSPAVMAFLDTPMSLGYAVGNNMAVEWRLLGSRDVPNDVVAQQLVALQPAAIVVSGIVIRPRDASVTRRSSPAARCTNQSNASATGCGVPVDKHGVQGTPEGRLAVALGQRLQ